MPVVGVGVPPRAICPIVVPNAVRDRELKHVPAGALFQAEADLRAIRIVFPDARGAPSIARYTVGRTRMRAPIPTMNVSLSSTTSDGSRFELFTQMGWRYSARVLAECARHDGAERRACSCRGSCSCRRWWRGRDGDRKPVPSAIDFVLREELDRAIRRAVDADLRAAHEAEPVLEADLRTGVEAEQILRQVPEIPVTQRTR